MNSYDIRYDDKYGAVRLAVIDGSLVDWHKHEYEDELRTVVLMVEPATVVPTGND